MSRVIGHYAPWCLVVLVGVLTVLTLLPAVSAYFVGPVMIAVLAAIIFLGYSIFVHSRHLCERCISSLPLDAAKVAGEYGVRFRVAHAFERKLFALGYLGVVVGCGLLSTHPVGRYSWAAAQMSLAYLLIVYVTHQRLAPWCPYCENGGEARTVPTSPTPVSTHL
jgi:hypothetical protein